MSSIHHGYHAHLARWDGLHRKRVSPRDRRLAVLAMAIFLSLGLTACSLSEDITPPPSLAQPASVATSAATNVPATAGPSATPEPVEPPSAIDMQAGQAIYSDHCAACHGPRGMGDGELAAQLSNAPAALGASELGRSAVPADWFRVITAGNMASFMPPFANALTAAERWNVTYYALSLSQGMSETTSARGLYETHCAECHGLEGAGVEAQAGTPNPPVNDLRQPQTLVERSAQDIFTVIGEGSARGMPPFGTTLSEDDRWALVGYVRSLSVKPGSAVAGATPQASSVAPVATLPEGITAVVEVGGLVLNGTTQQPAADLPISLRRFDGTQELDPLTGQTDSQGRFRFEGVQFSAQRVVIVEADNLDVAYFSQVAQAETGQAALELNVTVFETTRDTSGISIDRLHLFLEPVAGQDVVRVGALALVSNSDVHAVIAAATGEGTLFFDLPKGAVNLQMQEGELGGRFLQTDTGFADTLAVVPGQGSHQVVFSFDIPYTRSATLEFPVGYPVSGAIIVVPDGMHVESEALQDSGVRQIEGAGYRTYSGGALAAGQTLSFVLSGKPAAAANAAAAQGNELIIAAVVLGGVLIGAGLWGWWRSRRSDEAEAEEEADPHEERENLLQSIADLDDEYQNGRVKERDYVARRAALKQRLLDLTDDVTP